MSRVKVTVVSLDEDAFKAFSQLDSPEARRAIARNIMDGARAKLITIAGQRLNSTRMDYIQGVQPIEDAEDGVALVLAGALPLMVEHGWDERSLHETLLGPGAKGSVRVSKDGSRYRFVPFRHKTPGASNDQGGLRMGSAYGASPNPLSRARPKNVVADAAGLGKAVHKAAKKLKPGQALAPGLAPKLRDHHAADIYAGMRKVQQAVSDGKGGVTFQNTYMTFRTISERKKGPHWFHPGIEARNFFQEVEGYVQKVAPAAVEAFVKGGLGS